MVQPLKSDARKEPSAAAPAKRARTLDIAAADAPSAASPARYLQDMLAGELAGLDEPRWSARRTMSFVLLTNGLFWLAIAWALQALS